MNPNKWVGLGFVATAENAAPDTIKNMGPITRAAPQIAFGMGYPENDPNLVHTKSMFKRCKVVGLGTAGWAWCCLPEQAAAEAKHHAALTLDLGLTMFIANMEEPYDAHGNSNDPRMWAPDYYADAFRQVAPNVEFAITTTPRWASSGNQLRAAGACTMPQAFTGEVPSATISACVSHAKSWGWTIDRIRPLVQVYKTNDVRPSSAEYNLDAANQNVGVIPYILEQAFDGEGQAMIRDLAPSITRPPAQSGQPDQQPPPKPPPVTNDPRTLPFARALYPPDAQYKGKTPSTNGPDIEAVKRAISRAGYWRWQQFNRTYSDNFAHGNQTDGEGVAGFQRGNVNLFGKPASGWYGKATHEALRKFKLPNGQYAFDARAVALYKQAL
jgi:hypothetical protein